MNGACSRQMCRFITRYGTLSCGTSTEMYAVIPVSVFFLLAKYTNVLVFLLVFSGTGSGWQVLAGFDRASITSSTV